MHAQYTLQPEKSTPHEVTLLNHVSVTVLEKTPKVYLHSPRPQKSAGMGAYANTCHCDFAYIFAINIHVELLHTPQSKNAQGKGQIPPAAGGICILFLWDIQFLTGRVKKVKHTTRGRKTR